MYIDLDVHNTHRKIGNERDINRYDSEWYKEIKKDAYLTSMLIKWSPFNQ